MTDVPRQDPVDPGDHTTLLEVLDGYRAAGFSADFLVVEPARVRCCSCQTDLEPATVPLHSLRRLEGTSDPADMAAVTAMTCPACGARGTAVIRFGPEAGPDDAEVLAALHDERGSDPLPGASPPAPDG
jgi:hypothetical protein